MDFLLECIGFPPGTAEDALVDRIRAEGEGAPWRGDPALHLRVPLGAGLELRADQNAERGPWTVQPHFRAPHRLRVAVERLERAVDSPFDALLRGWASPPPAHGALAVPLTPGAPGLYRIAAWLADARRLAPPGRPLPGPGHVLAVGLAGFALNVEAVVPNRQARDARFLERPAGAFIAPLGGADDPGGCCDVSLRVRVVRRLRNAWTARDVVLLECDAPDRPLCVFVSPWQLEQDGVAQPRPGWRVEGTFLFTGRVVGGAPRPRVSTERSFG